MYQLILKILACFGMLRDLTGQMEIRPPPPLPNRNLVACIEDSGDDSWAPFKSERHLANLKGVLETCATAKECNEDLSWIMMEGLEEICSKDRRLS